MRHSTNFQRLGLAATLSVFVACEKAEPKATPATTGAPTTQAAPLLDTPTATITCSASASSDASESNMVTLTGVATCSNGEPVSYAWSQAAGGSPRVELKTPYAATTTFKAPEYSKAYELQFELRVSAHGARDTSSSVKLRVAADDDPPTAEAFAPAPTECGDTVTLVGQGRSEESDQALQFEWRQVGEGPRVQLEDSDRTQARFVVPDGEAHGKLSFEFHVRDGVNPDVVASTHVDFECDPAHAPLAAGSVRKFPIVDAAGVALPRGKWELTGELMLMPEDGQIPGRTTLRFEYGELVAGAVTLTQIGSQASLRMYGMQRDSVSTPWYEPESSGKRELGDWPADQPLGFAFDWDGHELGIHFGPPGARETWPKSPYPVSFPFASRPRKLATTAEGGLSSLNDLQLTGQ